MYTWVLRRSPACQAMACGIIYRITNSGHCHAQFVIVTNGSRTIGPHKCCGLKRPLQHEPDRQK
jgi:hypothetical protein